MIIVTGMQLFQILNKMAYDKYLTTIGIIGIFFIEDGNHKIAIRVNETGFNPDKSNQGMKFYSKL